MVILLGFFFWFIIKTRGKFLNGQKHATHFYMAGTGIFCSCIAIMIAHNALDSYGSTFQ